jgi:hypothetical protein
LKKRAKKKRARQSDDTTRPTARLSRALDGDTLRKLPNGIQIIRRKKHEWVSSLDPQNRADFLKKTNPFFGSKFLPSWTLSHHLAWLEQRIAELKWRLDSPRDGEATFKEKAAVGYSNGRLVHTIRLVIDSGFVHAYPVEDE